MTQTVYVLNNGLSGDASNVGFFYFGDSPNLLLGVQPGWLADGSGVVNGVVIDVVVSYDPPHSSIITINPSHGLFIPGQVYRFTSPPELTCFKENTKICVLQDNVETYVPIQNMRKGDLVKTLRSGYLPVDMIGKTEIYHPVLNDRINDQLYKCSSDKYPEIFEDLILTGCHCILVDDFKSEDQRNKTIKAGGKIYITDNKYRLPASVDSRTTVYDISGSYTIYHLALENDDYYMNYGIYANGLLVETCSRRYLKELSNMTLI